mmetsp:Transcript_3565/g.10367  ORF Transcript_3565/g.10367 Transcript_3565/m.10367 type:complete len:339 (-) Transcript_3565:2732-3748(-)
MQHACQHLHPLHQPGAGAAEQIVVRHEHGAGPDGGEGPPARERHQVAGLQDARRHAGPARRQHQHLRGVLPHLGPSDAHGAVAGKLPLVHPPRQLLQVRQPLPPQNEGREAFQGEHAGAAGRLGNCHCHSSQPGPQLVNHSRGLRCHAGNVAHLQDIVEGSSQGARRQGEHKGGGARGGPQKAGSLQGCLHAAGVGVAGGAGVLGQHQPRLQVCQCRHVDLEGAQTLLLKGLHGGLHLGRGQGAAVHAGAGHHRQLRRLRRAIALVRHPHHPGAEAQGPQDLSAAGQQADDAVVGQRQGAAEGQGPLAAGAAPVPAAPRRTRPRPAVPLAVIHAPWHG